MAAKLDVNRENEDLVYKWLKEVEPGVTDIRPMEWNFEKFLINCKGEVVRHHDSATDVQLIAADIEALLYVDNLK